MLEDPVCMKLKYAQLGSVVWFEINRRCLPVFVFPSKIIVKLILCFFVVKTSVRPLHVSQISIFLWLDRLFCSRTKKNR